MIKPSTDGKKLWFIPPEKSKEQELEYELVYAHVCPKCNNLVQALFMTDKRVDPKPWEEIYTKILDGQGHYKRIIPGRNERSRSRYAITTIGRGAAISAQLIRYTEHFDRKEDVVNTPVCNYVAISSTIPEYRAYDILLALLINPSQYSIKDMDWPTIKDQLEKKYSGPDQYVFSPAVGNGPECVYASRTAYQWFLQQAVSKYAKPYQPPVMAY